MVELGTRLVGRRGPGGGKGQQMLKQYAAGGLNGGTDAGGIQAEGPTGQNMRARPCCCVLSIVVACTCMRLRAGCCRYYRLFAIVGIGLGLLLVASGDCCCSHMCGDPCVCLWEHSFACGCLCALLLASDCQPIPRCLLLAVFAWASLRLFAIECFRVLLCSFL